MLEKKTEEISSFQSKKRTDLILKVPRPLLENEHLCDNEKLVLAFCWTLHLKLGFNAYSFRKTSDMLNLHVNSISSAFKKLVELRFLDKNRSKFLITLPIINEFNNQQYVTIPKQIYGVKIVSGAKLLWGEYNSMKPYFAKRQYTADLLNCSKNSITKWTKLLHENKLLKSYNIHSGNQTKQKVVQTMDYR